MANPRICSIPECGKNARGHGYCLAHYTRWRKYGDPLTLKKARQGELLRWLVEHQQYDGDGCLVFPYRSKGQRYGQLQFEGKREYAHRVMCTLAHGLAPTPRHEAAHNCGKGHEGCVHPAHLRWATTIENCADKITHGTHNRGERNATTKLTEANVREIRSASGTVSLGELASRFGVTKALVCKIQKRVAWAWLP